MISLYMEQECRNLQTAVRARTHTHTAKKRTRQITAFRVGTNPKASK